MVAQMAMHVRPVNDRKDIEMPIVTRNITDRNGEEYTCRGEQ